MSLHELVGGGDIVCAVQSGKFVRQLNSSGLSPYVQQPGGQDGGSSTAPSISCAGELVACSANVSSWGTLRRIIGTKQLDACHALLIRKHKLTGQPTRGSRETVQTAREFVKLHGCQAAFADATILELGHPSAGVAIVWMPFLSVVGVFDLGSARCIGIDICMKGFLVRLFCYYGFDTGTDNVKVNLLQETFAFEVASCHGRVLVGGDYNPQPNLVAPALGETHFSVASCGAPTYHSSAHASEIDFFVARDAVVQMVTAQPVVLEGLDVSPHSAVVIRLSGALLVEPVTCWLKLKVVRKL